MAMQIAIYITVPDDWERRLDMQPYIQAEIAADRWIWDWSDRGEILRQRDRITHLESELTQSLFQADRIAQLEADLAAAQAVLPCGHHNSLMLKSAETGEPLYCELCDCISRRNDAERMEQEAVADAERYRLVRRGQHWSVINGIGDTLRAEALDAAIDAIRKESGNG